MKLYELFRRVGFEDLIPTLDNLAARLPVPSQIAYFKMAFDELNLIEPVDIDDDINVGKKRRYQR